MFDATVARAPPIAAARGWASGRLLTTAEPGDLVLLSAAFERDDVSVARLLVEADEWTIGGGNLEALLLDCEYNRARPDELTDASFCNLSVDDAAFDGVLPVARGGTGLSLPLSTPPVGALVVGGPTASAPLTWASQIAGLSDSLLFSGSDGAGVSFGGEFRLVARGGALCAETADGRVSVDITDLAPSPLPCFERLAVVADPVDASLARIEYEAYHDDGALRRAHFCVTFDATASNVTDPYQLIDLCERTPGAVVVQSAASNASDASVAAATSAGASGLLYAELPAAVRAAGDFGVTGLLLTASYTLLAVVADAIGNMSPVMRAPMRTMMYEAPAAIHLNPVITAPTRIRFGAVNAASVAATRLTAGLLAADGGAWLEGATATSQGVADLAAYVERVRAATAPALPGGPAFPFPEFDIPAGAELDAYPSLTSAVAGAAAGLVSIPAQLAAVTERATYHGFLLYVDAVGGRTAYAFPDIYNPDVTPPLLDGFRAEPGGITETSVSLVWDAAQDV
jgi:hypothetical protein